jgi:hypothetical protein
MPSIFGGTALTNIVPGDRELADESEMHQYLYRFPVSHFIAQEATIDLIVAAALPGHPPRRKELVWRVLLEKAWDFVESASVPVRFDIIELCAFGPFCLDMMFKFARVNHLGLKSVT